MGTSSARRGPTTGLWRSAKGAATRYLSPAGRRRGERPGGGGPVSGGPFGNPGGGGPVGGVPGYPEGGSGPGGVVAGGGRPGVGFGPPGSGSGATGPGTGVDAGARAERDVGRERRGPGGGRGPDGAGISDRTGSAISGPAGAGSDSAAVSGHGAAPASGPGPGGASGSRGGGLRAAPGRFDRIKAVIEAGLGGRRPAGASPVSSHWQGFTGWTWVTEIMAAMLKNLG